MPTQRATWSLLRQAVFSNQAELRSAAADELRKRNLFDFVPVLVDSLANPIQWEASIALDTIDRRYIDERRVFPRWAWHRSANADSPVRRVTPTGQSIYVNDARTTIWGSTAKFWIQAICLSPEHSESVAPPIAEQNARIEALDRRINFVLDARERRESGDGLDFAGRLRGHSRRGRRIQPADDRRFLVGLVGQIQRDVHDVQAGGNHRIHHLDLYTGRKHSPDMQCSCFPAGTPVMTLTGPLAIENLRIGDRVLAQDPDSGELAYKPVLGTTIRPPAELLAVSTSQGELRLTRGHAMWIDGKGWRMAKESQPGDRLHCLSGATVIEKIAEQPAEAVYNLHIADFHTYFVGSEQILVHDNTTRLPTAATVPGLTTSQTPELFVAAVSWRNSGPVGKNCIFRPNTLTWQPAVVLQRSRGI